MGARSPISVRRAVAVGLVWVNGPVVLFMFGPMLTCYVSLRGIERALGSNRVAFLVFIGVCLGGFVALGYGRRFPFLEGASGPTIASRALRSLSSAQLKLV